MIIQHKKKKKDLNIRKSFKKKEINKILYKGLINNLLLNNVIRFNASIKLNKLTKISSLTKIRNRCIITGKSRSILRSFKLSRILFRQLALNGQLIGIIKST